MSSLAKVHAQALGPQLGKALAELGEAERDRQEHLQLYASFECAPAPMLRMPVASGAQTCFACAKVSVIMPPCAQL